MKCNKEARILLFLTILILPIILTLIIDNFSQKLLFLVPLMEFGAVKLYNTFIYTARGAGFDQLWVMIGTTISVALALILLAMRKQHVFLTLGIVIALFISFILLHNTLELFHKTILIWVLPFYIGVVTLSFQKNKKVY